MLQNCNENVLRLQAFRLNYIEKNHMEEKPVRA